MNASTPVIQVQPRPPRQPMVKKLVMKCTAMNKNMACTLQKWMLFMNAPKEFVCQNETPPSAMIAPLMTATISAASVSTPIVYRIEETYAGSRSGSSLRSG